MRCDAMNADHPSHARRIEAIRRAMRRDDVRQRIRDGVRAWAALPETKEKQHAAWANPAIREKRLAGIRKALDALMPEQVQALLEQLRRGDSVADVANDWLLSMGRVRAIARAHAGSLRALRNG